MIYSTICYSQKDSISLKLQGLTGGERVEELHKIVIELWQNYPKQAMKYGLEALEESKSLPDSALISKSLRLIGGIYYYQGDYPKSLEYNQQAFEMAMDLNDSSLLSSSYSNLGEIYFDLGSYQIALENLLRAKAIKEKIGESYGLSNTYNNIGLVFEETGDHPQARAYFRKAHASASGISKQNEEINALNNVGVTYLKEGRFDLAMSHYRSALDQTQNAENIKGRAVTLRGIGEVMLEQGMLDSAAHYFEWALELNSKIEDKKGLSESYYLLAKESLAQDDSNQALIFLDKSHQEARKIHIKKQELKNLQLYANIYHKQGNTLQETIYLNKYIKLRDSLFQDIVTKNLELIPLKMKQQEDRNRMAAQQAKIRDHETTNRFYAIIICITIPLLVLMIVLFRKNMKKQRELQQKNEELHKTQRLLVTSEKMASLGVLAAGVGHEINNPLNFIKNGIEALTTKLDKNDKELKSYLKIINEGVSRATNIVKSLSHFSRRAPGLNERCNIKNICENCLLILHNKIINRVQVVTDFGKGAIMVKGNEGRLHQAMLNIIANAVQAIKEEGNLTIITRRMEGFIEIYIEDDGEGIPKENLTKIADPFFTTKEPGEGTGLGLFITHTIIEEHGGTIDIKSNHGMGTKVIIALPL